jgi:DNA-binding transcriptional ArsR family regulator
MGVSERTVRHWLANLRRHGYVTTRPTGRATQIRLAKWQPFGKAR